MHIFEGRTANDVWVSAAEALRQRIGKAEQSSRGGLTAELLHVGLVIREPRERWVLSRSPAINPAFALAEVVWIVSGRQDSAFLNYWNPVLPRFAGKGQLYYGAYGFRLRTHFGPDQIHRAYLTLKNKPDSRQVVLQIWDPRLDLPEMDGSPRAPDIPCNLCSLVKVRDGRLEWVQIMRSNDLILGLPHNVVQFSYLQEMMAAWLGVEVGNYTHFSDSLHVYQQRWDSLNEIVSTPLPENTDRWDLGFEESMEAIKELSLRMDRMRKKALAEDKLLALSERADFSEAPANILSIVSADTARRRGWDALAEEIAESCSNPILVSAWKSWLKRTRGESFLG